MVDAGVLAVGIDTQFVADDVGIGQVALNERSRRDGLVDPVQEVLNDDPALSVTNSCSIVQCLHHCSHYMHTDVIGDRSPSQSVGFTQIVRHKYNIIYHSSPFSQAV
ncbi:hypothetical protein HSBGL_2555 [Halapricum desulfuricans]|uniref:Uncharacterized protein n=1 Tax=Halapricum desulfuricans TaxID=2841257 RepID=A0A897NQ51_9EURY|nr:hypothetical protein HSBGL_2555 [Halapricum desulfuricans]